ncbi:MAG: hypothetical protein L6R41_000297 [Letrouitia leprolyta]|nr:MAG: hypothetical protein L6R41_000297 [Letrouitia leprolyta]
MEVPGSQPDLKNPSLQIDFAWRNFKARISDRTTPSDPLYIVDFKWFTTRCIVVESAIDNKIIGAGTIHIISIHPDYELHGRKGTIKALKRWKTSYTHLSHAYAPSPDGPPMTMTWTSSSNFKTWDFICLDDQQMPVAKFIGNIWGVKRLGYIEFLGPKATSAAARDEIVVTGLTLFYTMIIRTYSIFNFFGAIFARTGPIKDSAAMKQEHKTIEAEDSITNGSSKKKVA